MVEQLLHVAEGQLGKAIVYTEIEIGQKEVECRHPSPQWGVTTEFVKIEPIKSYQDIVLGFAGRCSCGTMYYYIPR